MVNTIWFIVIDVKKKTGYQPFLLVNAPGVTMRRNMKKKIMCSYCFNEFEDCFLELNNYKRSLTPVKSYYCSAECLYANLTEYIASVKGGEINERN